MKEEVKTMIDIASTSLFYVWWNQIGSGITPIKGHDMEEHAERVAHKAWAESHSVTKINAAVALQADKPDNS